MKHLLMMAAFALMACGTPTTPKSTIATPVEMGATIELQIPDSVGGLTINQALWERRTSREFAPEALSLEELSGVVWAAAGINRPQNDHLTAPSALALYPIRTYVFFKEGVYRYDAKLSSLLRVLEGDHRSVAGSQPFVAQAPLNLVFVADMSTYEGRNMPMEDVRYRCGQDAMACVENVNLYAAGHDLKSVTRGMGSPELLSRLGLDPERYMFALAVTVGK